MFYPLECSSVQKKKKKKDNSVQTYFAYEMLHRNQLKFYVKVPEI